MVYHFFVVACGTEVKKLVESYDGAVKPELMTALLQTDRELTVPMSVYPLTRESVTFKKDIWADFGRKKHQARIGTSSSGSASGSSENDDSDGVTKDGDGGGPTKRSADNTESDQPGKKRNRKSNADAGCDSASASNKAKGKPKGLTATWVEDNLLPMIIALNIALDNVPNEYKFDEAHEVYDKLCEHTVLKSPSHREKFKFKQFLKCLTVRFPTCHKKNIALRYENNIPPIIVYI